jgi:hypothetical protein
MEERITEALKDAPDIISRTKVPALLGGLISRGYLQNLDSKGLGPRRIMIGRRCAYLKKDLIEWLVSRSSESGRKEMPRCGSRRVLPLAKSGAVL